MTRDKIKRAIAYIRVSTNEQGDSGAGLEAQRRAINEAARQRGWQLIAVYQDVASGKSTNGRHELKKALADLQTGRADALIVSKLDRLSRSVVDFGRLLELARRHNWAMVALDFDLDTSTPTGKLVSNVMMAVAEWERDVIGQRTREGLAAKRAQGVRLGRPQELTNEVDSLIVKRRSEKVTFADIAQELTNSGIAAPRGGIWNWSTVRRAARRHLPEAVKTRRRATL